MKIIFTWVHDDNDDDGDDDNDKLLFEWRLNQNGQKHSKNFLANRIKPFCGAGA